jgi:hypothetical protein
MADWDTDPSVRPTRPGTDEPERDLRKWLNGDPEDPYTPDDPGTPDSWLGAYTDFGTDRLDWDDGNHNYAVTDKNAEWSTGVELLTCEQAERWAGRPLLNEELERLAAAIPNSSIPEAIGAIVGNFESEKDTDSEDGLYEF